MSFIVREFEVERLESKNSKEVVCSSLDGVANFIKTNAYTIDEEKYFVIKAVVDIGGTGNAIKG